jgi:hypothetical protein
MLKHISDYVQNFRFPYLTHHFIFSFLSDHLQVIFHMSFHISDEKFRSMVLYDWKIGLTYKDSHARLVQAWGDQAPSDRTILDWIHEFEQSNFSIENLVYLERSSTVVTEETFNSVSTRGGRGMKF